MGRFYRGYEWAELVTDLNTSAVTGLTKLAGSRTVTYTLNKPASASGRVPSDDPRVNLPNIETGFDAPLVSFNDRLLYMFRREDQGGSNPTWVCRFAGMIMQIEDSVQGEQPYSSFTAYDPWQYLFARPVMNGTSLVGPDGISWTQTRGDVIALQILEATIGVHGDVFIDLNEDAWEATGQIDINFQQGVSVGQALQQLCQTGTMDIVLTPVYDPLARPGVCCEMTVYAQAGSTQDGAVFSWDVARSVGGISALYDGDLMANEVQFFAGQGGPAVAPAIDASGLARYGYWGVQNFFPGQAMQPTAGQTLALEEMAEFQLSLRKQGKRTIRITPTSLLAPIPLLEYGLGDRIPVHATNRLRQEIPWQSDSNAYCRVYGIPITLSDDGVEQVSGLVLSPDGF